jgi:hypothetical protein
MGNVRMEAADRADIDMQGMGGARDPEGRVNQWNRQNKVCTGSICLDLRPLGPSDCASQEQPYEKCLFHKQNLASLLLATCVAFAPIARRGSIAAASDGGLCQPKHQLRGVMPSFKTHHRAPITTARSVLMRCLHNTDRQLPTRPAGSRALLHTTHRRRQHSQRGDEALYSNATGQTPTRPTGTRRSSSTPSDNYKHGHRFFSALFPQPPTGSTNTAPGDGCAQLQHHLGNFQHRPPESKRLGLHTQQANYNTANRLRMALFWQQRGADGNTASGFLCAQRQ